MDKITKFLQKLTKTERERLDFVKQKLLKRDFADLDIRPIKSKPDYFRVRVGRYRLIFSGLKSYTIKLQKIVKRDDKTYKNL